jgi:hypothetical protein
LDVGFAKERGIAMEVSDSRFPSAPDLFDQSFGQPFMEEADSIIRNRPPLSAWVDIPIRKAAFPPRKALSVSKFGEFR